MNKLFLLALTVVFSLAATLEDKGLDIAKKYDEAYTGWGSYTTVSKMILKSSQFRST